nr:MAG TPA: tail assembly protein [Caudoviricetes sp.]DAR15437.1 MAG TPA: tail assembly protein [Caudoviricetes sp.]
MTAIDFENLDLDALRAEANNKYKNLVVRGVVFRGLMRVSKGERERFNELAAARRAGEDQADVTEFYRGMLMLVAEDKVEAEKLLDEIGEDAAVLDTLVSLYFEHTQVGEA